MKRQTKMKTNLCLAVIVLATLFNAAADVSAQTETANYKAGDRVECEVTGNPKGKWWTKGTIQPFKDGDFGAGIEPDGSWFRFKADANKVEYPCKPEVLRPLVETKATAQPKPKNAEPAAEEETMPALGLKCPVEQKQVKNGTKISAELAKQIIRCKKGEKAVDEGDEGAVTVEISAIQIGAARPWTYAQDSGNGKVGTLVHPVKATYTIKTFYRNATEVEEGWIRILNFYVNAFGEWEIGSEEPVKPGKARRINK